MGRLEAKVNVESWPDWKPGRGQVPVIYLTARSGGGVKLTTTEAEALAGWLMDEVEEIEDECQRANNTKEAVTDG